MRSREKEWHHRESCTTVHFDYRKHRCFHPLLYALLTCFDCRSPSLVHARRIDGAMDRVTVAGSCRCVISRSRFEVDCGLVHT